MGPISQKAADALQRAESLGNDLSTIFTVLDTDRIRHDAAVLDQRADDTERLPLYGVTISLKDLLDEQGQRTTAGSLILKDRPPAQSDAEVVKRLKAAGALLFGRTNLSEFAYSGVGSNPHHGTYGCVYDRSLIPGGSSSGAALSVACDLCDIAIGTDTGGSVRLPAALNGLWGFKPTSHTVSLKGVHPLSASYDSTGPLTKSPELLRTCMQVIRDKPLNTVSVQTPLQLAVAPDVFADDLDARIKDRFDQQCQALQAAGHQLHVVSLKELNPMLDALRLTVSYEARQYYAPYLDTLKTQGDPNVLARLHLSEGLLPAGIKALQKQRQIAIALFKKRLQSFDALIAPTVQCEHPTLKQAQQDFTSVNTRILKNTSVINLVDGCAMSLPVQHTDPIPAALMVCGVQSDDEKVLAVSDVLHRCLVDQINDV